MTSSCTLYDWLYNQIVNTAVVRGNLFTLKQVCEFIEDKFGLEHQSRKLADLVKYELKRGKAVRRYIKIGDKYSIPPPPKNECCIMKETFCESNKRKKRLKSQRKRQSCRRKLKCSLKNWPKSRKKIENTSSSFKDQYRRLNQKLFRRKAGNKIIKCASNQRRRQCKGILACISSNPRCADCICSETNQIENPPLATDDSLTEVNKLKFQRLYNQHTNCKQKINGRSLYNERNHSCTCNRSSEMSLFQMGHHNSCNDTRCSQKRCKCLQCHCWDNTKHKNIPSKNVSKEDQADLENSRLTLVRRSVSMDNELGAKEIKKLMIKYPNLSKLDICSLCKY